MATRNPTNLGGGKFELLLALEQCRAIKRSRDRLNDSRAINARLGIGLATVQTMQNAGAISAHIISDACKSR